VQAQRADDLVISMTTKHNSAPPPPLRLQLDLSRMKLNVNNSVGWGSSVSTVTGYGLEDCSSNSCRGRESYILHHCWSMWALEPIQ
jgi:hypothetical protein